MPIGQLPSLPHKRENNGLTALLRDDAFSQHKQESDESPLAERSEGKCVATRFIVPGWGGILGEAVSHPSAINVAATPLYMTPWGGPFTWHTYIDAPFEIGDFT